MTRFAPLTVTAGLFAAIALPLRTGAASDSGQEVDAWLNQHQVSLTMALEEKLSDRTVSMAPSPEDQAIIEPMVIRVSTVPVKRLTAAAAI